MTNPLLLRLILVYSICSFCNGERAQREPQRKLCISNARHSTLPMSSGGLFLSISMLAQASGGYDMSPKDVRWNFA